MENWTVYKHTSPSGKVYIGITKRSCKIRWSNGKGYKDCPIFFRAIEKYGWNNIKHEILFENFNEVSAKMTEEDLIYYYKSIDKSYNITNGGDGVKGVQKFGEDNPFYGHSHTDVAREKIAKSQIGENNSMFGTKAPCAIQVNGKYLTEYASEIGIPYKKFYLYYYKHNKDLEKTINYYLNKK